jgi:hypothetical protein
LVIQEPLTGATIFQMDKATSENIFLGGTTMNAVKTQVYCEITTHCLVAIVIYKLKASRLSLRYCTNTKTVFQMKHL